MLNKVWAWLLLPILMMVGPSTSQAMEMDEEDTIKVWQDPSSHPAIPHHYIPCPLNKHQLSQPYSINSTSPPSTLYKQQESSMREFYKDPPLTKPITSPKASRQAKASMQGLAEPTIDTRV